MSAILSLFDPSGFPARWRCGTWSDFLGWVHIGSDIVIFMAYLAIPVAIAVLVRRRDDLPFPQVAWLFAAFIASCGIGHLLEAVIFWEPLYRLAGLVKAITALTSVASALVLIRLAPALLGLPAKVAVTLELERSNRDLAQFASVAAHDLQEPLRKIEGYLGMIDRDEGSVWSGRSREHMGRVVDATERMREMILGVLDYAQASKRSAETEPVDLEAKLRKVIAGFEDELSAGAGNIRLIGEFPTLDMPRDGLRSVFENLVSNAIKYRGDRPVDLEISAARHGRRWQIRFRDHGIGIPEKDSERVFELFQRLHRRGEIAGTGLGLAICRRIVETLGGQIWIEPCDDGADIRIEFEGV